MKKNVSVHAHSEGGDGEEIFQCWIVKKCVCLKQCQEIIWRMAGVFHLLSQTTVLFRTKVCISGVGGSVYLVS